MAAGRHGVLTFDPLVAGVPAATGAASGGGLIAGAGVYYSKPTVIAEQGWSDVTDIVVATGTLAGTPVVEVSNASDDEVLTGSDAWAVETSIVIAAIAAANTVLVKAPRIGFGRYRIRFTYVSGSGTLKSRRVIKAS